MGIRNKIWLATRPGTAALGGKKTYQQKVLALGPIAYWPMNEPSGVTAINYGTIGTAGNGTYANVTLGATGIGDGNTCPLFDGATSYTDLYSAALNAAFNGQLGTVMCWLKVFDAAEWSRDTKAILMVVDTNNRLRVGGGAADHKLYTFYQAGGTGLTNNSITSQTVAWFHYATTWSLTNDRFRVYYNGAQAGADIGSLGTWVGNLDADQVLIGAGNKAGFQSYKGWIAHFAIFNKEATAAEIALAATL